MAIVGLSETRRPDSGEVSSRGNYYKSSMSSDNAQGNRCKPLKRALAVHCRVYFGQEACDVNDEEADLELCYLIL